MQSRSLSIAQPDQGAARIYVRFDRASLVAERTTILENVTFDLTAGAPTVLLGPNGSGKTTILRMGMGLVVPTSGIAHVVADIDGRHLRKAFVFQKPVMLRRSAAANIAFGLVAAGKRPAPEAVAELLTRVGLGDCGERPARMLSGGEQQRLALGRALTRDPEILFLDEPTASLDPTATNSVEEVIAKIAAQGVKVVMATHDLGQARRMAGDVAFLVRGRLIELAPAWRFFSRPETETARRFLAGELVVAAV